MGLDLRNLGKALEGAVTGANNVAGQGQEQQQMFQRLMFQQQLRDALNASQHERQQTGRKDLAGFNAGSRMQELLEKARLDRGTSRQKDRRKSKQSEARHGQRLIEQGQKDTASESRIRLREGATTIRSKARDDAAMARTEVREKGMKDRVRSRSAFPSPRDFRQAVEFELGDFGSAKDSREALRKVVRRLLGQDLPAGMADLGEVKVYELLKDAHEMSLPGNPLEQ